ncbi:MAG: type III PLP-dependent enzyme, partial [Alphaproteobacteria bacterium]
MTDKIDVFLDQTQPATPCAVVDLEQVAQNYREMSGRAPWAEIYYAVKANPAAPILECLAQEGSSFDAASIT